MRITDKGRKLLATLHPAPVVSKANVTRAIGDVDEAVRVLRVHGYRPSRLGGGYWQLGLGPKLTVRGLLARAEEVAAAPTIARRP